MLSELFYMDSIEYYKNELFDVNGNLVPFTFVWSSFDYYKNYFHSLADADSKKFKEIKHQRSMYNFLVRTEGRPVAIGWVVGLLFDFIDDNPKFKPVVNWNSEFLP